MGKNNGKQTKATVEKRNSNDPPTVPRPAVEPVADDAAPEEAAPPEQPQGDHCD